MPHSWIWRRSEMDSEHWGIWELLQQGIDRYKLVAVVVVVESFVLVTTLDDLRPPFGVHIHSVMGTFSSFRAKGMKVGAVRAWCQDRNQGVASSCAFPPSTGDLSKGRTRIFEGRFCNYGRIESTCGSCILVD